MRRHFVTAWAAVVLTSQSNPLQPQLPDWQWLAEYRAKALETFMPFENTERSLVVFRSYRDLYQDVHEYYFRISKLDDDLLAATVVTPIDDSIQQQLLDLHILDREAPFESLQTRVRVEVVEVTEAECPGIRSRLDALGETRFAVPTYGLIVLHPVIYQISINFIAGTFRASLGEDQHDLVRWALETKREFEKCVAKKKK